jgi:hypothetical protein
MSKLDECPKCKSRKIIPGVRIVDRGDYSLPGNLNVQVDENPDAMLFKNTHYGILKAWICGECGYMEMYVDNPEELYSAYQESISKDE